MLPSLEMQGLSDCQWPACNTGPKPVAACTCCRWLKPLLVHVTDHLLEQCMSQADQRLSMHLCICSAAAPQQLPRSADWILGSCRPLPAGCLLLQAKPELILLVGNLIREKALPSGQPCSARFVFTAEAPVGWLAELCTVIKVRW